MGTCEEDDDGVRWLDKKKATEYSAAKLEKSEEPARALRKKKWKGELPRMRMDAWRSALSTPAHVAMPNDWFREKGLVFLVDLYEELHPQRG